MENDNKIENGELSAQQRHKDLLLFLNKELSNLQTNSSSASTYNLEKEYAKTKNNKSYFVTLMLLGCFLVTVGFAFILSKSIDKKNQSIEINLEDFDSLNLKTLLDSVTKVQDKYNNAVRKLEQTVAQKEGEIKKAENQRDDDLFVLESVKMVDDSAYYSKRNAIIAQYEQEIKRIEEQYANIIASLEKDVEKYKKELETYDASKIESAKELEKALSSERSVQEMEKQQLIKSYEDRIAILENELNAISTNKSVRSAVEQVTSKYVKEIDRLDPVIRDEKAKEIVQEYRYAIVKSYTPFDYEQYVESNEQLAQNLKKQNELYEKYKYIQKFVSNVPQKNSIPSFVRTTDRLVDQMNDIYTQSLSLLENQKSELLEQVQDLNEQIDALKILQKEEIASLNEQNTLEKNALEQYYTRINLNYTKCIDHLVNANEQAAVVVYATDLKNIVVYVVPRYRFMIGTDGKDVEIFSSTIVKGRLVLFNATEGYYKFVPSLDSEGNEIPFDLKDIVPGAFVKITSSE